MQGLHGFFEMRCCQRRYDTQVLELRRSAVYLPELSAGIEQCRAQLPWWAGTDAVRQSWKMEAHT